MPRIYKDGVLYNTSPSTASQLPYDNSDSGLSATNVKSAIDELSSEKMEKANPTGTGSFSLNKLSDSTLGLNAVAVGENGTASGNRSFAEGYGTKATALTAHSEGYETEANGRMSHAEGYGTKANRKSQHVFGEFNDPESLSENSRGTYVEIVGNGNSTTSLSNARTLDWSGNEVLAGGLKINGNKDVAIQSDFTPTAGYFTSLHANFSGGNYSLTRTGKVVVLSFYKGITGNIVGNVEIAQLPSGFIPYAETRLYSSGFYNGSLMSASVLVSTDGKVYAAYGSNNLTTALTIAGVYICS